MTPTEHRIQSSFFQMVEMYANQDSRFEDIFAIPNGGKRDAVTGAIMKREGVKAGVLDVFVQVPSGAFHGLWIEFKRKGGRMSEKQKKFAARATRRGYPVIIANDAEDAFRAVRKYFDRPEYFEGKV